MNFKRHIYSELASWKANLKRKPLLLRGARQVYGMQRIGCILIRLLRQLSSLPANGSSTVACISDAQVIPTPPSVMNSCGSALVVSGPVIGADPICSGTKTYTWTYTDCTGTATDWVYTYTITPPTFITSSKRFFHSRLYI